MIYTYIKQQLINYLVDNGYFEQEQILSQNQIPNQNLSMFCRFVYTYGQTSLFTNKNFEQPIILSLEIYQLKNTQNNTIQDLVLGLRKDLNNTYFSFKNNSQIAKIENISLIRNSNDTDWNGFNLNISFQIYN